MMAVRTIFTVDDDRRQGWILEKFLKPEGYHIRHFDSAREVLAVMNAETLPDLILADIQMPGMDGIQLTLHLKKYFPGIPVVIMTAYGSIETAVRAIKAGASEFITKPIKAREIREVIRNTLDNAKRFGQDETAGFQGPGMTLMGQSREFREALDLVKRVAPTDITVLLRGESGTGKELFARTIHALSGRKNKAFVPVDCATLPETLMESELFGHEKGAFTDAHSTQVGKFELAHGGTLFLDEIGNLALTSQMKILRAIQERTIERLGSRKTRNIDVRIIAATNVDLENAIRNNTFREDLYFRLNEITIWIPPLRARTGDIELFAEYFLDVFNKQLGRNVERIEPEVLSIFRQYRWPGNVRELRNVMKRAVILADKAIKPDDLPREIIRSAHRSTTSPAGFHDDLNESFNLKKLARIEMQRIEEKIIRQALRETHWHLSRTAELLGIDRKTLRNKMREYQIEKKSAPDTSGFKEPLSPDLPGE